MNSEMIVFGGDKDAGHSAALTELGNVYVWGCDRWQQLGLGSADAGGVGYTWEGGRLWQDTPQRAWVKNIKHIACGSDHTVALSKDGSTVYTWGRGEHGQLGRKHKLFVGAPAPSPILSAQSGSQNVAFVIAVLDSLGASSAGSAPRAPPFPFASGGTLSVASVSPVPLEEVSSFADFDA